MMPPSEARRIRVVCLYSLDCREGLFSETGLLVCGVLGSSLRVDLLLHYRFDWLSPGHRLCVTMHHLPGALLGSKDHRNPKSERQYILPSACLCLAALYPHNVGKLRGHILPYGLEASDLAVAEL